MITADGFDNLRALIDPNRRAGQVEDAPRVLVTQEVAGLFCSRKSWTTGIRAIESTCWMLLRRYGIVFRELLTREAIQLPGREVLIALRRLEDRGKIRGGRFVNGFLGEQFVSAGCRRFVARLAKPAAYAGSRAGVRGTP